MSMKSFLVFKEATLEVDKTSSNIIPTVVENNINTLEIRSDRLRRKNYNMFRNVDDDDEEDDDIQPQIERGNTTY